MKEFYIYIFIYQKAVNISVTGQNRPGHNPVLKARCRTKSPNYCKGYFVGNKSNTVNDNIQSL